MLSQSALFHLFVWLSSILLYVYAPRYHIFIQPSIKIVSMLFEKALYLKGVWFQKVQNQIKISVGSYVVLTRMIWLYLNMSFKNSSNWNLITFFCLLNKHMCLNLHKNLSFRDKIIGSMEGRWEDRVRKTFSISTVSNMEASCMLLAFLVRQNWSVYLAYLSN